MHLEVIFISDLVEPETNTIRTNIQQAEWDEFIASKNEWLSTSPTNNARTIWKQFIAHISFKDRSLKSEISNPTRTSSHLYSTIQYSPDLERIKVYTKYSSQDFTLNRTGSLINRVLSITHHSFVDRLIYK